MIFVQFINAQHRTCGMQQEMLRILADPILKKEYLEAQAKFKIELAKLQNNKNRFFAPASTIYIPVAVHFSSSVLPSSSDKTCLIDLAQTQVNILNADYNGLNSDISLWSFARSFYPGTNTGSMDVQFVLSTQNHPTGTGLINGDVAVTFGTNFLGSDDTDSTWSGYVNIVCRNAGRGILGYSPLGGSPGSGYTVVIALNAFGSGAGCTGYVPIVPYNLGRTVTHELGHFFNLNHTFINGIGTATDCTPPDQDGISDTPKTPTASFGCPANGSIAGCTSIPSLTMNFMDYVYDPCMYMFTAGQATVMQAWYNTISSQIKTNVLADNTFLTTNFSILPNPSNGTFNIYLKEILENYSVEIYDSNGRIVYEKEFRNSQDLQQKIYLHNYSKGIYFLNIKSGSSIITKKMIIE